VTVACHSVQSD